MEKISYERRDYELLDDKSLGIWLYLENRRKVKFMKQRVNEKIKCSSLTLSLLNSFFRSFSGCSLR